MNKWITKVSGLSRSRPMPFCLISENLLDGQERNLFAPTSSSESLNWVLLYAHITIYSTSYSNLLFEIGSSSWCLKDQVPFSYRYDKAESTKREDKKNSHTHSRAPYDAFLFCDVQQTLRARCQASRLGRWHGLEVNCWHWYTPRGQISLLFLI
jgi:hypothetical protein